MSEPGKAVFLRYASQNAEAALGICDILRATGVEFWFDQIQIIGGDSLNTCSGEFGVFGLEFQQSEI